MPWGDLLQLTSIVQLPSCRPLWDSLLNHTLSPQGAYLLEIISGGL